MSTTRGMTVSGLIQRLETIRDQGHGDDPVQAWDPDSEQWEPVSLLSYGGGEPVRLYTDEP